ncbi:AraC family transcriptional regulator [Neptuniibacter caesariensis]|uniref:Transcriptional regulator, AraC/XylS family protein n=1 Tax=Neptuniibacter caesariensis TaxID=207954 RepID=A0A7U8GQM2_NEPCE|nr:AraC family transcriptional regulator [Neptuniibacter caesariensis]EAR60462.1 transcriptional regulator, AraC/XylS family protein [Oceanospirillum sp. MED92] [Neptuniibacter caesariensis]
MRENNQFHYQKSNCLDQVTLLSAQMNDFTYGKHAHEEFSIGLTMAGRQDFFANGEFHRSLPGNVMVFNPDQVHDGHSGIDDTLHYRMLYIHPAQLEPMFEAAGMKNAKGFRVPELLINDAQLGKHVLRLAQLFDRDDHDEIQHECELYHLAVRISQLFGANNEQDPARRIDTLLLRAKDYMLANLDKEASLELISQQANLSKYHFLRLFKAQFGITPHQYLINCRVNRARESLEKGADINDVVYECGFSDLSHLNRRFKPCFGMTPKQYQQLVFNS